MSQVEMLLEDRERLESRLAEAIRTVAPPDVLDPIIDGLSAVTAALWQARHAPPAVETHERPHVATHAPL